MFANVRIGQPVSHKSLTVFPLFRDESHAVDYLLSDEAMESGAVSVGEISQQGSVPELLVENKTDRRVLFLEGEQLVGAKQNRILNTSVLVPAHTKLTIPVSCVEHGRWERSSAYFTASKTGSSHQLRYGLKSSVSQSLKEMAGHRSDQRKVWADVKQQQDALGVTSRTMALSDTYVQYDQALAEAREALRYVSGACGVAVAIGPRIVTADLFDKPATCEKVWGRLLSGLVLDSLARGEGQGAPDISEVEKLLRDGRNAAWTQATAVGEGQEYRAEFDAKVGSALLVGEALVHGSVVA